MKGRYCAIFFAVMSLYGGDELLSVKDDLVIKRIEEKYKTTMAVEGPHFAYQADINLLQERFMLQVVNDRANEETRERFYRKRYKSDGRKVYCKSDGTLYANKQEWIDARNAFLRKSLKTEKLRAKLLLAFWRKEDEIIKTVSEYEQYHTMKSLKLSYKSKKEDRENEAAQCPVCMESMVFGKEPFTQLTCGHFFHESCFTQWYCYQGKRTRTCPLCRYHLKSKRLTVRQREIINKHRVEARDTDEEEMHYELEEVNGEVATVPVISF